MPHRTTWIAALLLTHPAVSFTATPVAVVLPETGQASQTLTLSGSLTARQSAQLSPQVAGLVAALAVDAGDRVAAGEVLVRLDQRMAELEVARVAAVVNEAHAALEEAERLLEEARRLVERRFVPDSEVQAREAGVLQAEAQLARTRSELAIARERLAQHIIHAPFYGGVSRRLAESGEWVATGTAVLELVAVDDLWLDARVHARVPVNDPAARTFLLRLLVHDESGRITPGMSARVRLELPGAVAVTLLRTVGDRAELAGELDPMRQVVVRGNETLREGEVVRIVAQQ